LKPAVSGRNGRVGKLFATPARDLLDGLDRLLAPPAGARRLATVFVGLALGWWIYVPIHELSHAAACRLAGGEVTRLEVQSLYGGGLLARVFPWVVADSTYAGRLSGFDTRGSDAIYLATDLGPFLWTAPGLWLLGLAARRGRPLLWGIALPWAFSPFLSLTGDAYEIGSILLTFGEPRSALALAVRGDDALAVWNSARAAGQGSAWLLATTIGLLWAFAWYLGSRAASRFASGSRGPASGPERVSEDGASV
jgi:hypothetical protein